MSHIYGKGKGSSLGALVLVLSSILSALSENCVNIVEVEADGRMTKPS